MDGASAVDFFTLEVKLLRISAGALKYINRPVNRRLNLPVRDIGHLCRLLGLFARFNQGFVANLLIVVDIVLEG